jgi:hypothetical protein
METREIWVAIAERGVIVWTKCCPSLLYISLHSVSSSIDNLESSKGLLPSVSEALLYLPPLTIKDWAPSRTP